jgi:hypothetical protein
VEKQHKGLAAENKAQGKRVEQAFNSRPAVKLLKTMPASAARYSLNSSFNLDGRTAMAEADFCNALTVGLKGLLHPFRSTAIAKRFKRHFVDKKA